VRLGGLGGVGGSGGVQFLGFLVGDGLGEGLLGGLRGGVGIAVEVVGNGMLQS